MAKNNKKKTRAVDEFKSNLLLLVHNLYPEGLPLSKLSSEYKKHFKDDIKTHKLHKDLGVPPNLGDAFWPRMFEGTSLRRTFSLQTDALTEEKVIKCIRSRSAEEMKLLAQLASYGNMQSLKYSKRGRSRKRVPVCRKCKEVCLEEDVEDDFDHYESQNSSEEEESENILEVLKEDKEKDLMVGLRLTSIKSGAVVASKDIADGLQLPLSNGNVENSTLIKLDPLDSSSACTTRSPLVECKAEAVDDNEEEVETEVFQTEQHVQNDPLGNDLQFKDRPGHRNQLSSPKDLVELPAPVPKISTRVLINHLGEVKIIKFLSVEQICQVCKTVFPDEADLRRHIPYCNEKQFMCLSCESTFDSEIQVLAHRLFCPEVEKRGTKRSASDSGMDQNQENAEMVSADYGDYVDDASESFVKQEVDQDDTFS